MRHGYVRGGYKPVERLKDPIIIVFDSSIKMVEGSLKRLRLHTRNIIIDDFQTLCPYKVIMF